MREYRVLAAALCMMLVSLIISGVRNISVSAAPESATYDIYEESERLVALTFDDGPKGEKTEALLDMLKEKGVHATFFMIGAQVEEQPELVRRIYEEDIRLGYIPTAMWIYLVLRKRNSGKKSRNPGQRLRRLSGRRVSAQTCPLAK